MHLREPQCASRWLQLETKQISFASIARVSLSWKRRLIGNLGFGIWNSNLNTPLDFKLKPSIWLCNGLRKNQNKNSEARPPHLPNNNNFNSRLASRLSFLNCRSISWLIRFCSLASSLRQQAMVLKQLMELILTEFGWCGWQLKKVCGDWPEGLVWRGLRESGWVDVRSWLVTLLDSSDDARWQSRRWFTMWTSHATGCCLQADVIWAGQKKMKTISANRKGFQASKIIILMIILINHSEKLF